MGLGREDPLEKEMATHSSFLAWEIPWIDEPGVLQSMGSQRVRHDFANKQQQLYFKKKEGIPGSSVVKNPRANVGDAIQSLG